MNNTETLQQVDSGYRMPRPPNCPVSIYEVMLHTWDAIPENRPTFAFLCAYFEDYFANAERAYRPANGTPSEVDLERLETTNTEGTKENGTLSWDTSQDLLRLQRWEQWAGKVRSVPETATVMWSMERKPSSDKIW